MPLELKHKKGERILRGRYEVERILGAGAYGTVYRVLDTELGVPKACKEMHVLDNPDTQTSERQIALEMFRREALNFEKIRHKNIPVAHFDPDKADKDPWRVCLQCGHAFAGQVCPVHGTALTEITERYYLFMDFIDGQSLEDMIRGKGYPLEEEQVLAWTLQVCDALKTVHGMGLVHRDIKPENIKVDRKSGEAFLVDFGLLKESGEGGYGTIKMTGSRGGGTLGYAPENPAERQQQDARSDIHALGMTMYRLLSGQDPTDPGALAAMRQHTPRHFNSKMSQKVESVIIKAIHRDPGMRYGSVEELVKDLEAPQTPLPQPQVRPTAPLGVSTPQPPVSSPTSVITSSPAAPPTTFTRAPAAQHVSVTPNNLNFGTLLGGESAKQTLQVAGPPGTEVVRVDPVQCRAGLAIHSTVHDKDIQVAVTPGRHVGAGKYGGALEIRTSFAVVRVPFEVRVEQPPCLAGKWREAATLQIGAVALGRPVRRDLTVFNTGSLPLEVTETTATHSAVRVSPSSFQSNRQLVRVDFDTAKLGLGRHEGEIKFAGNARNAPLRLQYSIKVHRMISPLAWWCAVASSAAVGALAFAVAPFLLSFLWSAGDRTENMSVWFLLSFTSVFLAAEIGCLVLPLLLGWAHENWLGYFGGIAATAGLCLGWLVAGGPNPEAGSQSMVQSLLQMLVIGACVGLAAGVSLKEHLLPLRSLWPCIVGGAMAAASLVSAVDAQVLTYRDLCAAAALLGTAVGVYIGPEVAVERHLSRESARRNLAATTVIAVLTIATSSFLVFVLLLILAARPLTAQNHHRLYEHFQKASRQSEALAHIEAAVKLQPKAPVWQVELYYAYLRVGKSDQAFAQLQSLREKDPWNVVWQTQLVDLLEKQIGPSAALAEIRNEVLASPTNPMLRYLLALLYLRANDPRSAETHLAKAAELWPEFTQALWERAKICVARQDYTRARGPLQRVVALTPDDAERHNLYGVVLSKLGDWSLAANEFQRATDLDSSSQTYQQNLQIARQFLEVQRPPTRQPSYGSLSFRW